MSAASWQLPLERSTLSAMMGVAIVRNARNPNSSHRELVNPDVLYLMHLRRMYGTAPPFVWHSTRTTRAVPFMWHSNHSVQYYFSGTFTRICGRTIILTIDFVGVLYRYSSLLRFPGEPEPQAFTLKGWLPRCVCVR